MTTADVGAELTLPLQGDQDIAGSRQLVRRLSLELGFSLVDQTKMVTATSELARNTVKYGGGGEMRVEQIVRPNQVGLKVTFVDQGPGIADIEQAMVDGWTTGSGLGLGLSGAKRLVNEFEIESRPGEGTRVTITRWRAT
ncbi:MAG TPA: anti-sigma regulatory factor [Gemmatimonadaceae bacterium]